MNARQEALRGSGVQETLHKDPWMVRRIAQALDAIRYADREGLEVELDLLAFAEDTLSRYAAKIRDSLK